MHPIFLPLYFRNVSLIFIFCCLSTNRTAAQRILFLTNPCPSIVIQIELANSHFTLTSIQFDPIAEQSFLRTIKLRSEPRFSSGAGVDVRSRPSTRVHVRKPQTGSLVATSNYYFLFFYLQSTSLQSNRIY